MAKTSRAANVKPPRILQDVALGAPDRLACRRRLPTLLALVLLVAPACTRKAEAPPGTDIGAAGGVVAGAGGASVSLFVPEGALTTSFALAVSPIVERLPGTVGPAVEATPHGTVFAKPVALRFKLTPRELPPGIHFGEVRVATLQDGRWQPLPTRFPSPGVVEGLTTHFSTFAIIAPCHVSGDGTDFPLSDCPTFNPRIQTSAPVALEAKGASITLALTLRPTLAGGPVDFTISGLTPGWTYFLSRDASSHLDSLPASGTGALTFTQDTSAAHHLLLMIRHGSVSLTAASCPQIGTWDAGTCTLTADILSPPIYIEEDDVQLDCAGHTIGGADTASVGIDFYKRRRVGVHHCVISNADYGIIAGGAGIGLSDLSVSTPAGATPGKMGFDLTSSSDLTLFDAQVNGFKNGFGVSGGSIIGFAADNGTNITISRVTLEVTEVPAFVSGTYDLTLDDLLLDGTLSGTGPADPLADTNPGAIQLVNATRTRILKLRTTGPMTAFGGIVTTVESGVTVEGANISAANVGLRLDDYGPDENVVTGSTFSNILRAVVLNGGRRTHLFRNNFFASGSPMVASSGAMELSDTDAGSPTFQQGNYWGRACPGPLFVAGADTTRADAVDSFPFSAASAWDGGRAPGCAVALVAPTIAVPVTGALLRTTSPAFEGVALATSSVELLEGGVVRGTATAVGTGDFQFQAAAPFAQGPHTVTARSRMGGRVSPASPAVTFTVDTVPPPAPIITLPKQGVTINESDVTVLGTAEDNSTVTVREGSLVLGSATATVGLFAIVATGIGSGSHTITASASDGAGNVSSPSVAVTFSVRAPTSTSPLFGTRGSLAVTSATSAMNPFNPSTGETNQLTVAGFLLATRPRAAREPFTAILTRKVVSIVTGQTIGTFTTTSLMPSASRTQPNPSFMVASTWNGGMANGNVVPPGGYLTQSTVSLGQDIPQGWLPGSAGSPLPPNCGPAAGIGPGGIPGIGPGGPGNGNGLGNGPATLPFDGPCITDSLQLLQIVNVLAPLPAQPPPSLSLCNVDPLTGRLKMELCNGLDDNCDGHIDEGPACGLTTNCPCQLLTCVQAGVTCGTAPDGCGGFLSCGGVCP